MNPRFLTLVRREWLQHRTGWFVLMLVPALLVLGLSFFDASFQVKVGNQPLSPPQVVAAGETALHQLPPLLSTSLVTVMVGSATLAIAVIAMLFQLPGLARRDAQDRSVEFWRALPVSDSQSLSAMLLTHLLAVPWAALSAGLLAGLAVSAVLVGLNQGPPAWLGLPWGVMLPALLAMWLRLTLGLVLALAWMLPLLLGTLLASAALRRWGVPLLGLALLLGAKLLDPRLPTPLVQHALEAMTGQALAALTSPGAFSQLQLEGSPGPQALINTLQDMPAAFWHDGLAMLQRAASPGFALALAVGAACFAALVWLRQRSV